MPFKRCIRLAVLLVTCLFVVPAAADPARLVAFGDSLMAGYGLGPGESFPEKLKAALRAKGFEVEVTGAGVSGDTTSDGLARVDWSVPDGTDIVILELGANDMLRGLPPQRTEQNLDGIIARLKERGIRVLLAGMLAAPSLGRDYAAAFNAIYPRLAQKHDVPLYPFFLEGVAANKALLLEDGMHPNAKGVEHIVEKILPSVEAMLTMPGDGA
jgi:acyl-CoA thioesterase-1